MFRTFFKKPHTNYINLPTRHRNKLKYGLAYAERIFMQRLCTLFAQISQVQFSCQTSFVHCWQVESAWEHCKKSEYYISQKLSGPAFKHI